MTLFSIIDQLRKMPRSPTPTKHHFRTPIAHHPFPGAIGGYFLDEAMDGRLLLMACMNVFGVAIAPLSSGTANKLRTNQAAPPGLKSFHCRGMEVL
jgi:hypothetical protein